MGNKRDCELHCVSEHRENIPSPSLPACDAVKATAVHATPPDVPSAPTTSRAVCERTRGTRLLPLSLLVSLLPWMLVWVWNSQPEVLRELVNGVGEQHS